MNQANTPTTARDWNKIVEESNGQMIRMPAALLDKMKAWHEKRNAFKKAVDALGKQEHELNHELEQFLFPFRQYLADNGDNRGWTADLGVNLDALADNEYIINVTKNESK